MTTDNRTNEPTEAQVEAAAKALRADKANRTDTYRVPEWEDTPYGDKLVYRGQARAALVAAAGVAALDGAPEPEAGTKVVIGKQNRGDDDESWTFTEWEPFELEKAREEFPNSVYEVVTVFGLPVEGESDGA